MRAIVGQIYIHTYIIGRFGSFLDIFENKIDKPSLFYLPEERNRYLFFLMKPPISTINLYASRRAEKIVVVF